jgi:type IV pilus assembly protein PilV
MLMVQLKPCNQSGGFTMIEILVTLAITAFGLLGLAGFVVRASALSTDTIQRARAAVLVNDMASRLSNSKAIAADFVTVPKLHGATVEDCSDRPPAGAARQLCEWSNVLAGANDGGGGAALLGYRGCVTQPDALQPVYVVTVVWGSLTPGTPSTDTCGAGVFGVDDSLRRVLRLPVRVATLAAA